MNKLDAKSLTTGFVAGITAALLVLGAAAQPTLASILYAASALPVLIVGLGWGNVAAITAIVTAALLGTISVSPMFAFGMAIFTLAPAGWLAHLGVMVDDLEAALKAAEPWGVKALPQGRNWLQLPDGLAVELIQAAPGSVAAALAVQPRG